MNKTLLAKLKDVASEVYGYAADEYNLARATGEREDERYLNLYNAIVTLIGK